LAKLLFEQLKSSSKKAIFVELALIINTILLKNDILKLCEQLSSIKGSENIRKYSFNIIDNPAENSKITENELSLNFTYNFSRH
jgi:hypothetical protein